MKLELVNKEQAEKLNQLGFISKENSWECVFVYNKKLIKRSSLPEIPAGTLMPHRISNVGAGENFLPAPTVALALKWLREKKNIHIYTYLNAGKDGYFPVIDFTRITLEKDEFPSFTTSYETNEEAENIALDYALDYLLK